MAALDVTSDPFVPGVWTVRSPNPAALAATCDAIVQVLGLEPEALAVWALHPDEQVGLAEHAYEEERRELGPIPEVHVVDLPRPAQRNVVWVDRVHLLAWAASPTVGSRLLGLYVGSPGRIVLFIHHPSVTATVASALGPMPNDNGRGWDAGDLIGQVRVALRFDPSTPDTVQVRAPGPMAAAVGDALGRLAVTVAAW